MNCKRCGLPIDELSGDTDRHPIGSCVVQLVGLVDQLRADNERLRSYDISVVYVVRPRSPFVAKTGREIYGVTVESCLWPDGSQKWAIRNGRSSCLAKDGFWQYEPLPSSRTDEFYALCRWDSLEEALAFARKTLGA